MSNITHSNISALSIPALDTYFTRFQNPGEDGLCHHSFLSRAMLSHFQNLGLPNISFLWFAWLRRLCCLCHFLQLVTIHQGRNALIRTMQR